MVGLSTVARKQYIKKVQFTWKRRVACIYSFNLKTICRATVELELLFVFRYIILQKLFNFNSKLSNCLFCLKLRETVATRLIK